MCRYERSETYRSLIMHDIRDSRDVFSGERDVANAAPPVMGKCRSEGRLTRVSEEVDV